MLSLFGGSRSCWLLFQSPAPAKMRWRRWQEDRARIPFFWSLWHVEINALSFWREPELLPFVQNYSSRQNEVKPPASFLLPSLEIDARDWRHNIILSTDKDGMAWHGMAWHGMAWHWICILLDIIIGEARARIHRFAQLSDLFSSAKMWS